MPSYSLLFYNKLSLKYFLSQSLIISPALILQYFNLLSLDNYKLINFSILLFILLQINAFINYRSDSSAFQISSISLVLGSISFLSIASIFFIHKEWIPLATFLFLLAFFHFSEFYATSLVQTNSASFALDQDYFYWFMLCLSIFEYSLELYYFPFLKQCFKMYLLGLSLCIFGEIVRKSAIYTAKSNFDHLIMKEKDENHVLVTHGIYSLCRHPSYLGWFCWAIGTQIMMSNPVNFVLFALIAWIFLYTRTYYEEIYLIDFFGEDYKRYQLKVGTGLPFIKGYI